MIIECKICGSYTEMDKPPLNSYCSVCCSIGSLYIQKNPTEEQLEMVGESK